MSETPPIAVSAISSFLTMARPSGFMCLVAIKPDGPISGKTFEMPGEVDRAATWATDHNAAGYNLYWTVNPVSYRINKKPTKADIAAVEYAHADIDPDVDSMPYPEARKALLDKSCQNLYANGHAPSFTIDTGNGIAPFWRVKGVPSIEAGEDINKRIMQVYNSDPGTWNIDRIMRLPGTLNYPNKRKLAKGYPVEPSTAKLLNTSDTGYRYEDLDKVLPHYGDTPQKKGAGKVSSAGTVAEFNEDETPLTGDEQQSLWETFKRRMELDARLTARWEGDTDGLSDSSRSGLDMSLGAMLRRRSYTYRETKSLLISFKHGAGAGKVLDGDERYFQRIWMRSAERNTDFATLEDLEGMIESMEPRDTSALEDINQIIGNSDLSSAAQETLHRKLKDKTGVSLAALRKDIGRQRAEMDQQDLVKLTIKHIGEDNLLYSLDRFWLWNTCGVWKRSDDRAIKQHIHKVYDAAGQEYGKGAVDSILDLTKTETFLPEHKFDQASDSINTLSGELHYEAGAWTLKPHEKTHYRTTQLPVQYDPSATALRFLQFLTEIFKGDVDAALKSDMVLELIGYTLLSTCRFEKFALLIGNGANDKSVLLAVIEGLLGPEYTVAVQPSQFDNRFQRAHLQGKLANIVTEIAEGAEIADAQLKAIVSGELTTAEYKHKPPFDFHPICTCWFGTNHMPYTRDFSDALFRRAVVITFPNKFEGELCDPHLKDKLVKELPGILNLALAAISGVFERGEFTTCHDNQEAKRRWRLEADQAAQFVDECCELDTQSRARSADVYTAYKSWAEQAGIRRTLNHNNFSQRLTRLGVDPRKGTGGARWLHGIRMSGTSGAEIEQGYKP